MSQHDVERVRAYYEWWNGRKWRPEEHPWKQILSHEAAISLIDPDHVYEDANLPDHAGEEYRGLDGVLRAGERWMEDYEWLVLELEQIIDAGERVVTIHKARLKMRHTGIEFETPLAYVATFRDGKVVHTQSFLDVEEALKAVGLAR
jgi:ketosteroid isomerase-like protein